ncbi:MAG TPA: NUDIX hydrolase [Nitrososphaeraceae archaeon]|jgi:ADP-ribose pyrophosphatase
MTLTKKNQGLSENISIVESKPVYRGDICVRVDKILFDQNLVTKEIVEHSESVGIIPVTNNDEVLMVLQYRHAVGRCLLEIPAGKIERGESPEKAAVREMAEEIGFSGNIFPFLQIYLAPGYDTELMHVFIARDLQHRKAIADDDERIVIKRLKISDVYEKALNGEIVDSKTIASILAYCARFHSNE